MVGITIQNRENQNDKPIGIRFGRKDHLAADVILSLVHKVSQLNARFNALDKLIMTVHSVMMAVGFGRGMKSMGQAALRHGPSENKCRGVEGIREMFCPRNNNSYSKSEK
jgi:hypothetical protein